MTFALSEWIIIAIVGGGLIFPFLFLYWLVYNAEDDVPKDLQDAEKE